MNHGLAWHSHVSHKRPIRAIKVLSPTQANLSGSFPLHHFSWKTRRTGRLDVAQGWVLITSWVIKLLPKILFGMISITCLLYSPHAPCRLDCPPDLSPQAWGLAKLENLEEGQSPNQGSWVRMLFSQRQGSSRYLDLGKWQEEIGQKRVSQRSRNEADQSIPGSQLEEVGEGRDSSHCNTSDYKNGDSFAYDLLKPLCSQGMEHLSFMFPWGSQLQGVKEGRKKWKLQTGVDGEGVPQGQGEAGKYKVCLLWVQPILGASANKAFVSSLLTL